MRTLEPAAPRPWAPDDVLTIAQLAGCQGVGRGRKGRVLTRTDVKLGCWDVNELAPRRRSLGTPVYLVHPNTERPMATDRHQQLIRLYCERDGYKPRGFKRDVLKRLQLAPWRTDGEDHDANAFLLSMFRDAPFVPDAHRIRIERGKHWLHSVLVIEVLEVVCTHEVKLDKRAIFEDLSFACDATEYIHLRARAAYGPTDQEVIVDCYQDSAA